MNREKNNYLGLLNGKVLQGMCSDLDIKGNGVVRVDNQIFIIPGLLPGEEGIFSLSHKSKSIWYGKLKKITTYSQNRVEPTCNVFQECGGCSLLHLSYSSQQSHKLIQVKETLRRIGLIDITPRIVSSSKETSTGYRNRTIIPLKRNDDLSISLGYYRLSSHDIVDISFCPILNSELNFVISSIKTSLEKTDWTIGSDIEKKPAIKYIGMRTSLTTGKVLMTIIANSSKIKRLNEFCDRLYHQFDSIIGITLNVQPNPGNKIFGSTTTLIVGQEYIHEKFCNVIFHVDSTCFFQVNLISAELAVNEIIKWVKSKSIANLIDCYCGIGTISLPLAKIGINVLGIELMSSSIQTARNNAIINNIVNINFITGNVTNIDIDKLLGYEAMIIDPPRKGLDHSFIETILILEPKYIAYLSCNPSTLSRDLRSLVSKSNKYLLEELLVFDFFPNTTHIECLAFLSLKD